MLAVITSFFNSQKYNNLYQNYKRFKHCLDADLFTIELSFDGEYQTDAKIKVAGNEFNLMWQKERLLNILIESLPSKYTSVCWVDADLVFCNMNWIKETERALEKYPIVQPYSFCHCLNSKGEVDEVLPSQCYQLGNPDTKYDYALPGYVCAARREVIQGGLMDEHILGGADFMMMHAWYGKWENFNTRQFATAWAERWMSQAATAYRLVKGQMGYVPGDIIHLYHGTRKNRKYVARTAYLREWEFDPVEDIRIDRNGLWCWSSDKHELHDIVAKYFKDRKEDEV